MKLYQICLCIKFNTSDICAISVDCDNRFYCCAFGAGQLVNAQCNRERVDVGQWSNNNHIFLYLIAECAFGYNRAKVNRHPLSVWVEPARIDVAAGCPTRLFDDDPVNWPPRSGNPFDARFDIAVLCKVSVLRQLFSCHFPVLITAVDVNLRAGFPTDELSVDIFLYELYILNLIERDASDEILREPELANGTAPECPPVNHKGMAFENLGTDVIVAFDDSLVTLCLLEFVT
ncbi:hypothetical protein ES703_70352 [subsurface metagenome]